MPDLHGRLTPQGNLDGTLHTIVYANNYNSLDNKPSINSVTLQGNKTASELGLAVPADITVTSVNGETGAVVLDGTDINYDSVTTINGKLDDLQSQIDNSGVLAVNGKTGVVTLTGSDINYSAGVTLNSKIDAVEAEIPTVSYPVTSVNTKTGAVVLDGSDIKYDTNTTINAKIDEVEAEIPTVDYPVTSVNGETGTVVLDGTDINYDTNTTVNAKIDVVQGSIPTTDNDISHYTGTPTAGTTAEAIGGTATIPFTGASGLSTNNCVIYKKGLWLVVCIEIVLTSDQSGWYDILTTDNDVTLPIGVPLFGVVCTDSESIMPKYCQVYQNGTKMTVRIRNGKSTGQYRGQIIVPLG